MSEYEFEVRQMAKYLKVYGMYSSKVNHQYAAYSPDVNKDMFDWKPYGQLQPSDDGGFRFPLDLSDAVLSAGGDRGSAKTGESGGISSQF